MFPHNLVRCIAKDKVLPEYEGTLGYGNTTRGCRTLLYRCGMAGLPPAQALASL